MTTKNAVRVLIIATLCVLAAPGTSFAYVGPGLGAGAIGAVVGVIGAVLLALFSIVYYPIKRVMRRRKTAGSTAPMPAGDKKTPG